MFQDNEGRENFSDAGGIVGFVNILSIENGSGVRFNNNSSICLNRGIFRPADPRTDLLINIVPEGFFMDTAARIAGAFCGSVLIVFALSLFLLIRSRQKSKSASSYPEVSAGA